MGIVTFLMPLLLGYLAIVGAIYLGQDRLLYFPLAKVETDPGRIGLPFETVRLMTDDGETLHGWYLPHPKPRGALLFMHGNAGNIGHRLDSLAIFHRLGLTTLIFDYRGYGASSGSPDEDGTYRDAEAAWEHLVSVRGFAPDRIVLFGRSLGGAIAARHAADYGPAALIVESTMSSVADLGAELYPWLPVRWLARNPYPAAVNIARYGGPVLVAHSIDDEIIPYRHAARLLAAAGARGRMLEMRGGHNDGFLASGETYVAGLDAFLGEVLPP